MKNLKIKSRLKFLLIALCLIACTKPKPVLLYDETKVSKSDIVTVTIPNDIEIFKVDDKYVDTPMTTGDIELKIPKGAHSFTVRYYCMWQSPSGENTLLKSKKVTFSRTLESNKSYCIIHWPHQIKNYTEALALEKSPKFELAEVTPGEMKKDEIIPTQLIEEIPEEVATEKSVAPEKNKDSTSKQTNSDKKSLDVLKLIWENSSDEDKKEFLKWLEKEKK